MANLKKPVKNASCKFKLTPDEQPAAESLLKKGFLGFKSIIECSQDERVSLKVELFEEDHDVTAVSYKKGTLVILGKVEGVSRVEAFLKKTGFTCVDSKQW
jgi:hypothetical protein